MGKSVNLACDLQNYNLQIKTLELFVDAKYFDQVGTWQTLILRARCS